MLEGKHVKNQIDFYKKLFDSNFTTMAEQWQERMAHYGRFALCRLKYVWSG
ncbi:conserved hypothetical protein [Candidatus Nitrotoga fabula]|uniref:Uncharacterized protein n=1 Tax=Candidatus Nitrotoga fabula TaxID=2182327 RepID=A0A916FAH7_9PROT|nr:conserved hypothetical protein [Candidatus Nitrotoga fabula]